MRTTRLVVAVVLASLVMPAAMVSGQTSSGQPVSGQPVSGQTVPGQPVSSQPGSDQTLADVARTEAARRKAKPSGKVYTNDSLRALAPAPAPSSDSQSAATTPSPSSTAAVDAPNDTQSAAPADAAATAKDEGYWKKRLTEARTALDRAKTFADALQSRINALNADFTARADPAQRAEIASNRQKALAELDRVRKEVQDDTKAIADIQEEGRRAGVPSGWLR